METSEAGLGLNLDKATYVAGDGKGQPCSNCNGPLGAQYWNWQAHAVCENCKGKLSIMLTASQSPQAFRRALLLGGGTALGCGIAYAVFVALSGIQLALVTIGIAFLIAKVVRRYSFGVGGRKYQILAVALTYLASAMGYAPAVVRGFSASDDESAETAKKGDAKAAEKKPKAPEEKPSAGQVLLALALVFGFTLAAPILAATEAPIGLLIVGFGLWEAWKLTRSLPLELDGPYRTAGATGPPEI